MKKKGFTLMEVLVVVSVIAILAVIAVPSVKSITENAKKSRFKADVRSVISAIELYNATVDNDSEVINVSDKLSEVKTKLEGKDMLSAWPKLDYVDLNENTYGNLLGDIDALIADALSPSTEP